MLSVSQSDVEKHTLAKYLMELTLLDYDMVHYRPSEVAAAALCLSQLLVDGLPWVSLLELNKHVDLTCSVCVCFSLLLFNWPSRLSLPLSSTTPLTTRPT